MGKQHKLQRRERERGREREREREGEREREREGEREREINKPLASFSPRPLAVRWVESNVNLHGQTTQVTKEREREREEREREGERERETNKPLASFSPRPLAVRWVESTVNLHGQTTQVTKEEREREREGN